MFLVTSDGPSERRTAVERGLALVALAGLLGAGAGIWLLGRGDDADPDLGPVAAAIDWSNPEDLPPPVRDDFRSELVSAEDGYRFWPRSGRVTPTVAYRFDTGHCGLAFLTDFDGSFWRPIDPSDGEPPGFFINQDAGLIALVDFDSAVYRSSGGREVSLERVRGPVVTQPCD
jgi:hypothetical protein